jgi:spore germination protein GerM
MFKRLDGRIPSGVIAGVMTLGLLVGCGRENQTVQNPASTPSPVESAPVVQPKVGQTAQIYLLEDRNNKLELVPRPITLTKSVDNNPSAALEEAFNRLLTASTETQAGASSSIPTGTKLRSLTVKDDSVAVDLSKEFTTGGGTASMQGRLGQIIYTATSLNPKAKVFLSVEGKPLTELGGEGLVVDQPMTRQAFDQDFQL